MSTAATLAPARSSSGPGAVRTQQAKRGDRKESVWSFGSLFASEAVERIAWIKQGVPPALVGSIADRMGVSKEWLYATLGLSRATIERRAREAKPLAPDESARLLGMARLVGQVQQMVEGSGAAAAGWDSARWLARWLESPLDALGGRRPAEYLDTVEGQMLVSSLLSRAESEAYS